MRPAAKGLVAERQYLGIGFWTMQITLPLLHGVYNGPFWKAWHAYPPVVLGLMLPAIAYLLALRRLEMLHRPPFPTSQIVAFYAGISVAAVALLGPPDAYNEQLLFLHMIQHLLLMQIAAPLILLGRPVQLALRALPPHYSKRMLQVGLRLRPLHGVLAVLAAPVAITLLFNGNLVLWHIPALYDAALRNTTVHDLEHLTFFVTALILWRPIIDPVPRHHRLPVGFALAVVFFTMLVGIAVGVILTLDGSPIYPFYQATSKPWGLTTLVDQQLAGLIMWVGGGLVYTGIVIALLIRAIGFDDDQLDADYLKLIDRRHETIRSADPSFESQNGQVHRSPR